MVKKLTTEELQAIRDRAEKALKGEWFRVAGTVVQCMGDDTFWGDAHHVARCERVEDAEFITKAHEDIPKLLDEVGRLQDQNDRLMRFLHAEGYIDDGDDIKEEDTEW